MLGGIEMPQPLRRSRNQFILFGVCGGIAEFFWLQASHVRILWFILTLFNGTLLLLYIGLCLIVPYQDSYLN